MRFIPGKAFVDLALGSDEGLEFVRLCVLRELTL